MSPGPLLSYTIMKSVEAKKKGYLVGLFVSTGHMIIELILIIILMNGLGILLSTVTEYQMSIITIVIGLVGGCILVLFGSQLLNDIRKEKIDTTFLNPSEDASNHREKNARSKLYNLHPIMGSIIFLMSNPYWWLWWSTAGFSIIVDNGVSFHDIPAFIGLIIGKELGVYLWYTFIGAAVGLSSKFITKKIYIVILLICALFMAGYGLYLIIRPIIEYLIL